MNDGSSPAADAAGRTEIERFGMSRPDFFATLKSRVLVNDGGMGTQLIAAGMPVGHCSELWNLERPDAIVDVHERYANAGCDLLTTNSFGGTRRSLMNHGCEDQVVSLNVAAAKLARQAAGDRAWVMGDVGPFGDFLEPLGTTTEAELMDLFIEQIAALKQGGADGINIETMSDPGEATVAVRAAKQVDAHWPVMASFCFQKSGGAFRTMMGTDVDTAIKSLFDAGADVAGTNCGTDLSLDDYVVLAEQMVQAAGERPVVLSPNAGAPVMVDGQATYKATPEQMAGYVPKFLNAGVRVLGGCCGTTPAHLKAMAEVVKA